MAESRVPFRPMLIFISGQDHLRVREQVDRIKAAYLTKHPDALGLFVCDFGDADAREAALERFSQALHERGLFAAKKFVIARDAFLLSEDEQEKLAASIEGDPAVLDKQGSTVVLFWEGALPRAKKNHPLLPLLEDKASIKERLEPLSGALLKAWVSERLKRIDPATRLEPQALELLLAETGPDAERLDRELEKLAAYRPGGVITAREITLFFPVARTTEAVFSALSALMAGDKRSALLLFERQIAKGEHVLGLMAMCAWQLRQLLKVAEAYHTDGLRDRSAVAQAAGIAPFQAAQALRAIGRFPVERVARMFDILETLDRDAKRGGLDPALALTLFVARA